MRSAVAKATQHAAHRAAFGKLLIDQPLMRNVLADLCVESEAATALAMRLARAYDEAHADARRRERTRRSCSSAWRRRSASTGRCKRAPQPRVRVARVPRRQRLRRGVGHAAPVPRGAAGLDLGGLGQRHGLDVLRALARTPRVARGVLRRGRAGRRRRRAPRRPRDAARRASSRTPRRSRRAPAASSRAWRLPCRARCSCATRRRPSPTRSAPRASAATAAWSTARCRRASTSRRSSRASTPAGLSAGAHAAPARRSAG